ncbi:MAG: hypothetical protein H7258_04270 [Ferruginibacter sp.]|nr:hypothetical protein [Ferruginibacter sp.]
MKKIKLALLALVLIAGTAYGQSKAAPWPEMKAFHSIMAGTFHPAEGGDLKPLRAKADSLFLAAKTWQSSKIPADFKPKETTETLEKLVKQTSVISDKVKGNADDKELTKLISDAHDTFHKIVGECKKTGEHEGNGH